jgi:hypothetical protein
MKHRTERIEEGARSALLDITTPHDERQPLLDELRAAKPDSPVFDLTGGYPDGAPLTQHDMGSYWHHAKYSQIKGMALAEHKRMLEHHRNGEQWQFLLPYGVHVAFRFTVAGNLESAYTVGDGFNGLDITNVVRKTNTLPTHVRIPFLTKELGTPFSLELHGVLALERGKEGTLDDLYSILLDRPITVKGQVSFYCYSAIVDGQEVTDPLVWNGCVDGEAICSHGILPAEVVFVERICWQADSSPERDCNVLAGTRLNQWLSGFNPPAFLMTCMAGESHIAYIAHFCREVKRAELYSLEWITLNDQHVLPVLLVSPVQFLGGTVCDFISDGTGYDGIALTRGAELTLERFPYMRPTVAACKMEKGTDVLPLPSACPACHAQPLRSTKGGLWCINRRCSATLLKRIRTFLDTTRMVGLSDANIYRLIVDGKVSDLTDLYCLSEDDFAVLFNGNTEAGREVVGNLFSTLPDNREDMFLAVIGNGCTDSHAVSFSTLLEENGPDAARAVCEEHFQEAGLTDVSEAYDMWRDSARLVAELMSLTKPGG